MTSKIKLSKTDFYKKLLSCDKVDIVYNESFSNYKARVKKEITELSIKDWYKIDKILNKKTNVYSCIINTPSVVNIDLLNTTVDDVPKTFRLNDIVAFCYNGTTFTKSK
jgi:hypothetical protein